MKAMWKILGSVATCIISIIGIMAAAEKARQDVILKDILNKKIEDDKS